MVSNLNPHDIDAVKTVLESIIVKNRIENILPRKQEPDWEKQMREVQHEFREKASIIPNRKLMIIIDEAVSSVRAEEKHSNGDPSVGA